MKKTYLSLLPILAFLVTGCPANETPDGPDYPDDGYIHTVREVRELDYAPEKVSINGRVVAKGTNSFLIYDGTGLIMHYGYNDTRGVNINDKVNIKGATGLKRGLAQFGAEGTECIVTPYEGNVPEFDFSNPTEVTSLQNHTLTQVEYVTMKKTVSYKDGNYYQAFPLEGETFYLSYSGSQNEYMSVLDDTAEDAPKCVDVVGFLTGFEAATGIFQTKTPVYMLLSKAMEEVSLELKSVTASDSFPYYNLSTAFDDYALVDIHAIYDRGLDRRIALKDTTYVVEDLNGGIVDTSKPFTHAGQYIVSISYGGKTAEAFDIRVHDDSDTVVYMTTNELGEKNEWDGSSGNKVYKEAIVDENIKFTAGGGSTGKYSSTNGCWTITQDANDTYPDGGYLKVDALNGHYITHMYVKYSPNDSDEEGRNGYLDNLPSGEVKGVGLASYTYYVKPQYTSITNARVRVKAFLVTYSDTEPVVNMTGIDAINTRILDYERFTPFAEVNGLHVTATFDNGRIDTLKANEYTYVIKDENEVTIDPTDYFPHGGDYKVYVSKDTFEAAAVTIHVTDLVSLALEDTHTGDYERFSTFASTHGLKVTATYDNERVTEVKAGAYTYVVKDNEGTEIDPNGYFPAVGTYKVVVKIGLVTSNEITIRVSTTGVINVSKTTNEIATFNGWEHNKTYKTANFDSNISLKAGGSASGRYNQNKNAWTINQKKTNDDPNGGYLTITANGDFELASVKVTYHSDSTAILEGLQEGVAMELEAGTKTITFMVEGEETKAVLTSISITYNYVGE